MKAVKNFLKVGTMMLALAAPLKADAQCTECRKLSTFGTASAIGFSVALTAATAFWAKEMFNINIRRVSGIERIGKNGEVETVTQWRRLEPTRYVKGENGNKVLRTTSENERRPSAFVVSENGKFVALGSEKIERPVYVTVPKLSIRMKTAEDALRARECGYSIDENGADHENEL